MDHEYPLASYLSVPRSKREWETVSRVRLLVRDMKPDHICNALNMLIRAAKVQWLSMSPDHRPATWWDHRATRHRAIAWLLDEVKRRGIDWLDKVDDRYFGAPKIADPVPDPAWLAEYLPAPSLKQAAPLRAGEARRSRAVCL